jgi:hypothetical protein
VNDTWSLMTVAAASVDWRWSKIDDWQLLLVIDVHWSLGIILGIRIDIDDCSRLMMNKGWWVMTDNWLKTIDAIDWWWLMTTDIEEWE